MIEQISFFLLIGFIVLMVGLLVTELIVVANYSREHKEGCTDGHRWRFDEQGELVCVKCSKSANNVIMEDEKNGK